MKDWAIGLACTAFLAVLLLWPIYGWWIGA